jgi:hypothetical protein
MKVDVSFASEGSIMGEWNQWNDLYGEGGSRKKQIYILYFSYDRKIAGRKICNFLWFFRQQRSLFCPTLFPWTRKFLSTNKQKLV